MTGRRWAVLEDEWLESVYGLFPAPVLAHALNRTHKAVRNRASGLGLKIDGRFSGFVVNPPVKENHHAWTGDNASYNAEHLRAIRDFPLPLGLCRICEKSEATERARIDHCNLPYRPEFILPMCASCNRRQSPPRAGTRSRVRRFVILFREVK